MTSSAANLNSSDRSFGLGIHHQAVKKLVASQSRARFVRLLERMKSKRRLGLTALAVVLAAIWLGQAILGVMFRATAPAGKLMVWIPLSLGTYCIWNFLKAAGQKPVEPFEWTESEREWLLSAPLPRQEAIAFRFSSITRAALIKSLIFGFVMIPDLRIIPLGFLGILAALIFIDLVRMLVESIAWGLNKFELLLFRTLVFGAATIVVGRALLVAFFSIPLTGAEGSVASFGFLMQFINELISQAETWYGKLLLLPFSQIASVIVAHSITIAVVAKLVVFAATIMMLSKSLLYVDRLFSKRHIQIERQQLATATRKTDESLTHNKSRKSKPAVSKPWGLKGIGGLAWRQWLGAWEIRGTLAVSLLIPALLSCMPAMAGGQGGSLVTNTIGALAFYSLVLLPAGLKFDFRRDVYRLTMLKALPITPLRAVIGQLLVPTAIATLFQIASLALVMVISPYNPLYALIGMVFLLPFNLFIFSFENLSFLWFPHRLRQEGLQVLMRSILAFTAKSMIFAAAFIGCYAWVLTAKGIHENFFEHSSLLTTANIFAFGILFFSTAIALLTFAGVVRAYDRFDPSSDLSAVD